MTLRTAADAPAYATPFSIVAGPTGTPTRASRSSTMQLLQEQLARERMLSLRADAEAAHRRARIVHARRLTRRVARADAAARAARVALAASQR